LEQLLTNCIIESDLLLISVAGSYVLHELLKKGSREGWRNSKCLHRKGETLKGLEDLESCGEGMEEDHFM
jgi:hypothetical protein